MIDSMRVAVDAAQKCFIIANGECETSLGFEEVYARACEIARRLSQHGQLFCVPLASELGTEMQYEQYQQLVEHYKLINDDTLWFDHRTPSPLIPVLEKAFYEGSLLRIFYGNAQTGEDLLYADDTQGYVSRDNGLFNQPILISPALSESAVLDTRHIVRIVDLDTGEVLYSHRKYHPAVHRIAPASAQEKLMGHTHVFQVKHQDEFVTREGFMSEAQAQNYLKYVTGQTPYLT